MGGNCSLLAADHQRLKLNLNTKEDWGGKIHSSFNDVVFGEMIL